MRFDERDFLGQIEVEGSGETSFPEAQRFLFGAVDPCLSAAPELRADLADGKSAAERAHGFAGSVSVPGKVCGWRVGISPAEETQENLCGVGVV